MGVIAALSGSKNPITLSISSPNAYANALGGLPATTSPVTVTATGGIGSFTYSWTKVFGDTLTLSGASSNTTTFTGTPGLGNTLVASYKCTVTDSIGDTEEIEVSVIIYEISYL